VEGAGFARARTLTRRCGILCARLNTSAFSDSKGRAALNAQRVWSLVKGVNPWGKGAGDVPV
jgi:hypothetical protein